MLALLEYILSPAGKGFMQRKRGWDLSVFLDVLLRRLNILFSGIVLRLTGVPGSSKKQPHFMSLYLPSYNYLNDCTT